MRLGLAFLQTRLQKTRGHVINTKILFQFLFINFLRLGFRPATFFKKRFCHRCFPVNFAKLLRTLFFPEHLWMTALDSPHLHMFCKMDVLKDFAIITGKHLCWSLFFNKVTSLKVSNFIRKRHQHSCFPVNITKL